MHYFYWLHSYSVNIQLVTLNYLFYHLTTIKSLFFIKVYKIIHILKPKLELSWRKFLSTSRYKIFYAEKILDDTILDETKCIFSEPIWNKLKRFVCSNIFTQIFCIIIFYLFSLIWQLKYYFVVLCEFYISLFFFFYN